MIRKQGRRSSVFLDEIMDTAKLLESNPQIRIDKEGCWHYNGLPIINRNSLLFFNRHLEHDGGGGYRLMVGREVAPLVVEDTPYVVDGLAVVKPTPNADEVVQIRLNDETKEILDLETFYIGNNNVPYCRVKKGAFPARFLRAPYYSLAQNRIHQDKEDLFYILLNGQKHYINIV